MKKPSLIITWAFLGFVIVTSILFFALNTTLLINEPLSGHVFYEHLVFLLVVFFLLYGNVIYLLTRMGNIERERKHRTPSPEEITSLLQDPKAPTVTILIPSYKESEAIILMTVLSAIMQPYPHKRVVLLIDDSPYPKTDKDAERLRQARSIPSIVHSLMESLANALKTRNTPLIREALLQFPKLVEAKLHDDAHCRFFMTVLNKTIASYQTRIDSGLSQEALIELSSLLDFSITTFERKQFENLSHEPNKAMNLNSYIGLMGKAFVVVEQGEKKYIQEEAGGEITIADTDFVLTLDADSILLPEYLPKLMYRILHPENERLAVIQTPYSSFPEASSKLEYTAGITTDIQYLIHQGFTKYRATYWVGANALIRKAALEDIKHSFIERGFTVWRYVHDRTLIEDTESSIDLLVKGWGLYNYPKRLAYSATPADFGALIIQRRRWANGGLIIFPKLFNYFIRRWHKKGVLLEFFVRAHYLLSIAGVNIGLLILILYPFNKGVHHISLIILASAPYFMFYTFDLMRIGYRWNDVFPVYGLNLLLIPVNIVGVMTSLYQGLARKKIPFGRTPKIQARTTTPVFYIVSELLLIGYLFFSTTIDSLYGRWDHAIFSLVNGVFFFYAFYIFIGFGNSLYDIKERMVSSLKRAFS